MCMNAFSIPIHKHVRRCVTFAQIRFCRSTPSYVCMCVRASLESVQVRHVNKLCMHTIMAHCALRKHFPHDITINNTRRLKHRYKQKEFRFPLYGRCMYLHTNTNLYIYTDGVGLQPVSSVCLSSRKARNILPPKQCGLRQLQNNNRRIIPLKPNSA